MHKEDLENPLHQARDQHGSVQGFLIGKEELLRMVKRRKVKFFGHMVWHNSLQKTVMEGRVARRQGRECLRRRWEDVVKGMLNTSMQGAGTLDSSRQADI